MNALFERGSIPALEAMVRFSTARHAVLAANIAHASTAGYRTQDLSERGFRAALARAFERPSVDLRPSPSPDAGPLKSDGNNVDLEVEAAKMVRNQGLHAFAAGLLAQQLTMLREAVAERILA
ncbi:MAG TPA: hypothetical protein VEJ18_10665 [Planctomycetota bacterium]|nr:hypothetical protein [Planctomycetota bacterium]